MRRKRDRKKIIVTGIANTEVYRVAGKSTTKTTKVAAKAAPAPSRQATAAKVKPDGVHIIVY